MLKAPPPIRPRDPAWRAALREIGWPTALVLIDFETFFDTDYSLRDMSTYGFVYDPRYEEIGRAILHVPDGRTDGVICWSDGDCDLPLVGLQAQYGENLEGCTVVAHNLAFDGLILHRKYGIEIPHAIDLLGLARHENSQADNSLEAMAKREGLPAKGDTKRFLGMTRAMMQADPEKRAMMEEYATHDVWLEWYFFQKLMPRLSRPWTEARLMRHTLKMFWKPLLALDAAEGDQISGIMQGELDAALTAANITAKEVRSTKGFPLLMADALRAAGDDPMKYMKIGKPRKDGTPVMLLAASKTDDAREELLTHPNERVRQLIEARVAVYSWPNHVTRIARIQEMSRVTGGRLPVPLKYHGAHTGRWSGGEKINLQNLGSRGDPLITRVRGMIQAPPGHKLVVVDASAIEARVLAWLAEHHELCHKFAAGAEIYCDFAAKVLGKPVFKARKDDPAPVAKWRTWARNSIGKVGILGCGYGMGPAKTVGYSGNTIDLPTAERLVRTYRTENVQIVKYWHRIEQKFKAAAQHGEPGVLSHGTRVYREDGDVYLRLPSGRVMRYAKMRVRVDGNRSELIIPHPEGRGEPTHTWGGTLTENITQAVARDLLAESVLATEAAGYPIALHVHDEDVAVTPAEQAEECLAFLDHTLSTPPSWAAGCPLAAEGKILDRYEK